MIHWLTALSRFLSVSASCGGGGGDPSGTKERRLRFQRKSTTTGSDDPSTDGDIIIGVARATTVAPQQLDFDSIEVMVLGGGGGDDDDDFHHHHNESNVSRQAHLLFSVVQHVFLLRSKVDRIDVVVVAESSGAATTDRLPTTTTAWLLLFSSDAASTGSTASTIVDVILPKWMDDPWTPERWVPWFSDGMMMMMMMMMMMWTVMLTWMMTASPRGWKLVVRWSAPPPPNHRIPAKGTHPRVEMRTDRLLMPISFPTS